jgi:[acyl-carrier-protein] S-malonyltransferase
VRWEQDMRRLLADGFTRFVEVGPGRVLAGLLRKIDRKAEVVNISDVPAGTSNSSAEVRVMRTE